MVLLCANDRSRMTSCNPPWPDARTSGTPFSGGESWPSGVTRRIRPGRSVTSMRPSGRNASAHGLTRPVATVWTSSCPADEANQAFSPRAPVAIRNDAVSTIPAASAAATHTTGVFICKSPSRRRPLFWKKAVWKKVKSDRKRHRHADLDRQHGERDDQAQRERADRERGRDGVGQSGRGDGRGVAFEACRAGRPYHGRKILKDRGRITRGTGFSQESQAIFGRRRAESGKTTAAAMVMPAVSSASGLGGDTG